jgi:hypothetical protein
METKELAAVVAKWAPTLGSYIGGPLGSLALTAITSAYGLSDKFDLKTMADEILKNPYRLKELEIQHREKVGDQLVGLIEQIEGRASNGLLWAFGILFGIGFIIYVVMELLR